MNKYLKWLVTLSGLALMLLGVPMLMGVCVLMLALVGGAGDLDALPFSLSMAFFLVVTFGCGGVAFYHGMCALIGRPSGSLRLPPAWALGGSFVLVLVAGLLMHAAVCGAPLIFPPLFLLAVALPPVTGVAVMVDRHPGALTWRRALVAFCAGATVSTSLAIVLNTLLPGLLLALVWGLADQVLPALEKLLDALAGGRVADALTSRGFLFALVELAIIAPFGEEFVKPVVVLPLLRRLERRDALLLGACAGAGFAALEDALYAGFGLPVWAGILLLRAMGAPLHSLGAGLTTMGWWEVLQRRPDAGRHWLERYGLAVGIHALWNGGSWLVIALILAGFFGPVPETSLLGLPEVGLLLALLAVEGAAIWIGARALSRRLLPAGETLPAHDGMPIERALAVWAVVCLAVLVPVGLTILRSWWVL